MTLSRFLFAVFVVAGCGQQQTVDEPVVVASVDGLSITEDYFQQTYVDYLISAGTNDTPAARYAHLDNLIDIALLSREAVAVGLDRDSSMLAMRERERKKALGGAFFDRAFLQTLPELTEAEERRAFLLSKEQRIVRQLFYRNGAAAAAAYARIFGGKSFLEEARDTYGLTAIDSSAGLLGVVKYYQLEAAFAEAAFSLPVDSISRPIRTRYGYHILRVDDIIRTPLVTESEFQTARGGIASKYRLHLRMREGDAFVRNFMEARKIVVDPDGIALLARAIKELENSVEPQAVEVQPQLEMAVLNLSDIYDNLQPSTPLATYTFEGEEHVFTAADYHFWLPDLPFQEASLRTAASVGRALRNEIFGNAGASLSQAEKEVAEIEVENAMRLKLSGSMRTLLRSESDAAPTEQELRDAFDRSGFGRTKRYEATYWTIPFASKEEAESAAAQIRSRPSVARSLPGFEEHERVDLNQRQDLFRPLTAAVLGEVAVTGDGTNMWYAFSVEQRRELSTDFEDVRDQFEQAIRPLVPEYRLIKQLRSRATIEVDTQAFESLMG